MKNRRTLLAGLFMACGMAALTAPAFAERNDCGPMMGGWEKFHEQRAERMQQHQQKLHEALKLSSDQEAAWKKFTESMQPPSSADRPKPEEWSKLTAPERADKMVELAKKHQDRLAEHAAAITNFYAALTPEQKKTFDDFHSGPRGMGRSHHQPAGTGMNAPSKG